MKPAALRIRTDVLVGVALAVLTLASLGGVCQAGFIDDFDDDEYVSRNPDVLAGWTASGLGWALTSFHSYNWHPLTWLSLQTDAQFFGTGPRAFHRTNLLLHTANVLLLFGVLRWLTGDRWRSAVVAAFFAVHPLHVESVAWVAERKDELSALFWMLSLAAYAAYAHRPGPARYALVVLALALGLAAKPMLVTLPCVLLLLDYWPLGRLRRGGTPVWRLVAEKLPLLALAAGCSAATLAAQERIVKPLADFSLPLRVANALVSYATYLRQTLWPADLAFFYPHPGESLPAWQVAGAAALLGGITALAVWQARRRPYLVVGWLWYLGTLVPVIGLVQVGLQGHADRYTYIPLIGIFIMVSWGVPDLLAKVPVRPAPIATTAAALVAACAVLSWVQVSYWQDSLALWQHTLEVTTDNYLAHEHIGGILLRRNDIRRNDRELEAAREHFSAGARIKPEMASNHAGLAEICIKKGQLDTAVPYLEAALRCNPRLAYAEHFLADVYALQGKLEQAAEHYRKGLHLQQQAAQHHREVPHLQPSRLKVCLKLASIEARLGLLDEAIQDYEESLRLLEDPAEGEADATWARGQFVETVYQIGVVRARQGQVSQALENFRRAVELAPQVTRPQVARYRCALSHALYEKGDKAAAAREYREASRFDPRWQETFNQTARLMATHPEARWRDGRTAVELAQQVCEATDPPRPEYLDTLAAALAESGRFAEAVTTARRALERATAAVSTGLAADIRKRLAAYEAGKPWRETTR
jgi:tetratricopeptide (TPR) repeat protein